MTEQRHHRVGTVVKVVVAILLLLAATLGGIELLLRRHLTTLISKHLVPSIAKETGCDLSVEAARASLLGRIEIKGISLSSPQPAPTPDPLLTAERIAIRANVGELRQRTIDIPMITAAGMNLTITRGPEGTHNVGTLLRKAKEPATPDSPPRTAPAEAPHTPTPPQEQPAAAREVREPLGVRIGTMEGDLALHYIDYYERDTPLHLTLDLDFSAQKLSTVKDDTTPGIIAMRGHLAQNPDLFKTDLIIRLDPLHTATHPSFVADGTVVELDMNELGGWQERLGITSRAVTLKIELACKDGIYDPARSRIVARLKDAQLTGKLADKNPKTKLPPDLSLTLPISGPFDAPTCNLAQALLSSLLQNTAQNIDYILDETTIDGKSLRSKMDGLDEKINKELGRLFK